MAKADKPLSAKSSIGEWLKHPVGGALLREMLAEGDVDESVLRPVRMLALQRLVSLSQGQLSQELVDDLVREANGGSAPAADEEAEDELEGSALPTPDWPRDVVVVVGVGGMGETIARRQGAGRRLLLADFSEDALERVGAALRGDGFEVATHPVDVSSRESVTQLVDAAAALGSVAQVIHTAGLSPVQAPIGAIVAVDLIGVALVLEEFAKVVAPGGAGVVISSMAGYGVELPTELADALAVGPVEELASLPAVTGLAEAGAAYSLAKRANQLRVQAASVSWGARGARVNSISPGVISTPMGQQELAGDNGDIMRAMIASSGTGRLGTPSDIADAAAFLLGPTAGFVTGIDLLVDGGVIAAQRVS